jgi:hypothetical protein
LGPIASTRVRRGSGVKSAWQSLAASLKELAGDFKFVRKALARRCVFWGWITRKTDSAIESVYWA